MSLSLLSIRGFLLALVAYGADVPAAPLNPPAVDVSYVLEQDFINVTTTTTTTYFGPILEPNPCFNMKTSTGVPMFNLGIPVTTNYTTEETSTTFVLFLDESCQKSREFMNVLTIASVPNNTDDGFILQSHFNPVNQKQHPITKKTPLDFEVTYVCPLIPANYTILLEFEFLNGEFDPPTATWVKECFPALPATPTTKADEGWSTTGIVFFTGFMITLVFCVLGCGYNYVQQGRAGTDIIPCISVFRACKAKAQGDRGYSPQMDYTSGDKIRASDGGDGAYGSVYHTDL